MLGVVAALSNLFFSNPAGSPASALVRSALSLILAPSDRLAADREIGDFLRLAGQRAIDLNQMAVAQEDNRLLWALLPMPTLGRTLQLLSPNYLFDAAQVAPAGRLIDSVCDDYARRGATLAQVLIDPTSAGVRTMYLQHGFIEMAELKYLQAQPRISKPMPELPPDYFYQRYSDATHDLFAEAIRASYKDSLDCPALNGMRDMDDVLAGHRSAAGPAGAAEFDPRLWRVLLHRPPGGGDAIPRGVMLLCRIDPTEAMELVYIGLAPEARGRGLGSLLVRQALADAATDNRRRLTLAVDSRNRPAMSLYFRHGFQKMGEKLALIRDLRTHDRRGLPAASAVEPRAEE
jgi:ribosomal protein S18 acetylase RimI-like enzyme